MLALVPLLSIAENIYLGNEITRNGLIDWPETFRRTEGLLAKVGLQEPPTAKIESLGVGKQQLVEIAKALAKKVKLLILDEPTSALDTELGEQVMELIRTEMKRRGTSAIVVTHDERITQYCDRSVHIIDGRLAA